VFVGVRVGDDADGIAAVDQVEPVLDGPAVVAVELRAVQRLHDIEAHVERRFGGSRRFRIELVRQEIAKSLERG
jgi:hypothetical protein